MEEKTKAESGKRKYCGPGFLAGFRFQLSAFRFDNHYLFDFSLTQSHKKLTHPAASPTHTRQDCAEGDAEQVGGFLVG